MMTITRSILFAIIAAICLASLALADPATTSSSFTTKTATALASTTSATTSTTTSTTTTTADKRAARVRCNNCALCTGVEGACKDLAGQACNAWYHQTPSGIPGGAGGYPTEAILRGTITRTDTKGYNWLLFTVTTCYVAGYYQAACPAVGTVLNITQPASASCRDEFTLESWVLAVSALTATTATHTHCQFAKRFGDLQTYDTQTLSVAAEQYCLPLIITEFKMATVSSPVAFPTDQYIEIYNSSPDRPIPIDNLRLKQDGSTVNVLPTAVNIPPQSYYVVSNLPTTTAFTAAYPNAANYLLTGFTFSTSFSGSTLSLEVEFLPSDLPLVTIDTSQAGFPSLAVVDGSQAVTLQPNYDNDQYPAGLVRYNFTQAALGSSWDICYTSTVYGTSTCTPGQDNGSSKFPFGKRDVEETVSVKCLIQNSSRSAYSQDFCGSKLFRSVRDVLQMSYRALAKENTFKALPYAYDVLTTSLGNADELLVLGDPFVEKLRQDDLDAIYFFVSQKGGAVLANVNSQGKGALALVNILLGAENKFSTNSAECKTATSMPLVQDGFLDTSSNRATEYLSACYSGLSCTNGISLARDDTLTPSDAQSTLCYAEVGLGRVLFVTSWNAFMPAHGLLDKADNKQVLLNFMESTFLL